MTRFINTRGRPAAIGASFCAAVSFAIIGAPALAQSAHGTDNDRLEEIVVTAQKRSERLQDVPLSITVASGAQLERQQINNIVDLSRMAPSLEITQAGGNIGGGGQIRGIGTQSFEPGAVASVGIVVDQVSQGNVNVADLFDIDRIEVLKGPQGTLFGLTTSAGVINIVTNKPSFSGISAKILTELSSSGAAGSDFGNQVVQGMVNFPIAPTAALRLTGNLNLRQGPDRNNAINALDHHFTEGLRGRFRWEPMPALSINVIGDYTRTVEKGPDFFVITKASTDLAKQLSQCGIVASGSNQKYCSNVQNVVRTSTYGGSVQIDYTMESVIFTSITALRGQKTGPTYDDIFRLKLFPFRLTDGPSYTKGSLFSEELRAASPAGATLEYLIGLFYADSRTHNLPVPSQQTIVDPGPPEVLTPIQSLAGNDVRINDRSAAIFGQATWHVGPHLRLLAGARYTSERLTVPYQSADLSTAFGAPTSRITNFSWKIGAQYEFNRDMMSYATVARGYKGPQIALGDQTVAGTVPRIIRPEIPTSYELGFKATTNNGRLAFDVSLFYSRVVDFQGQLCTPVTLGLNCNPENIGNIISKGVEFNVVGHPFRELTLNSGIIYNPVKFNDGFLGSDGTDLTGRQLTGAPRWKFTFSGEYKHEFSEQVEGFLAFDSVYKSALLLAASTDPNVVYPAHWILGGRIGVRAPDNRWSVSVFGRNLTDNHESPLRYQNFPDTGSYGDILTFTAFRQVGLAAEIRF